MKLNVMCLFPNSKLPRYATDGSGCFDIPFHRRYSVNYTSAVLGTGLAFEIPEGYTMLVFSRSGHGFKRDLRLANCVGVIDSDYRGELMIKLRNDGEVGASVFEFSPGDFIAQAMLVATPKVSIVEVQSLSDTSRGEGGFGSTG
jgi:dUTP pyrophosphatase